VKEAIAATKPELPAARQKLIHSGKVLKDTQVLSETGIAENEFLVCMVTKEAKVMATGMYGQQLLTALLSCRM
jgi:UV excision repair protein RAD23